MLSFEPHLNLVCKKKLENIKSRKYYGSEAIFFLGPKIWELLPNNIKDSENLNIFKSSSKSWKPENCPCLLCRLYIADIGYILQTCFIN